jgi:hypothetical protein
MAGTVTARWAYERPEGEMLHVDRLWASGPYSLHPKASVGSEPFAVPIPARRDAAARGFVGN